MGEISVRANTQLADLIVCDDWCKSRRSPIVNRRARKAMAM